MPNRLANETSPYLLQHKDNPVDWYPWGEDAFQRAKKEDKPVFLSVGYSSCHWCHVMEHESFEDEATAELMNKSFVCVKVDREERPDIDEAYMTAVQLSAGRGGWPMSVFLTPDRKPFFAGTYFPKENRSGYPGFKSVLTQIASAWATKKSELKRSADEFAVALKEALTKPAPGTFTKLDMELVGNAVKAIAADFDPLNGGTLGAPKFPPHTGLDFLMRFALMAPHDRGEALPGASPSTVSVESGRGAAPNTDHRSQITDHGPETEELRQAAIGMALLTLEKMCLGGIHDQVGGGFHRYSTDEKWILPHFEKMLGDNALLLGNLARGALIASQLDERLYMLFYRSMSGIVAWLMDEMVSPEGLFYSALDADSEGVEGKFYVWKSDEVKEILGDRADAFLKAFNFADEGNFEDEATHQKTGENIPYLTTELALDHLEDLAALHEARSRRVHPGLDDKALVGWNALMISSLVESGIAIGQAERAASAILAAEQQLGSLPHQISKGRASGPAFLDDYAYFASALLALAALHQEIETGNLQIQGELPAGSRDAAAWKREASRLIDQMIVQFYDEERGGFFYTSEGQEELFGRTKQAFDQPLPSPNAIAIRCLIEIGDLERAAKSLEHFVGWMERAPTATEALYSVALEYLTLERSAFHPSEEVRSSATAVVEVPEVRKAPLPEVSVRLVEKEKRAQADGTATFTVAFDIPAGLHINSSDPPARWLTATRVEVEPLSAKVEYPPASNDRYTGEVEIPFTVSLPGGESGADFEVKATWQACTESECQLPQEKRFTGVVYR